MNVVRCKKCGELSDVERAQTCRGCGQPLSAEPAGKRPRQQISAVQREASDDLFYSRSVLAAILAAAGLGVALIFIKNYGFSGGVLASGLVVLVLIPILSMMKKRGKPTAEVPAPKAPRVASAQLQERSAAESRASFGSAVEEGCGMVLKVVGIFIAVILGLAALGFLILWISCMGSSWGHF